MRDSKLVDHFLPSSASEHGGFSRLDRPIMNSKVEAPLHPHSAVKRVGLSDLKARIKDRSYSDPRDEVGRNVLRVCRIVRDNGKLTHSTQISALKSEGFSNLALSVMKSRAEASLSLHLAVKSGDLPALQALLKYPSIDLNARDWMGRTALHWAVERYFYLGVECLLKSGKIKIDIQDNQGKTALQLAVHERNFFIAALLQEYEGTNINFKNDKSAIPFLDSIQSGIVGQNNNVEVAPLPLHLAVKSGDLPALQALLRDRSIDLNARDWMGRTAFHWAMEKGFYSAAGIISRLSGAGVNDQDYQGRTPLHLAAWNEQVLVVGNILSFNKDVDVDIQDNKGKTPLHLAAERNYYFIVSSLLKLGKAKVDIQDHQGKTALQLAKKNSSVAEILLLNSRQNSADDQAHTSKVGLLTVNSGVSNRNLPASKDMFENSNVNVNARSSEGKTDPQLAREIGNPVIEDSLSEYKEMGMVRKPDGYIISLPVAVVPPLNSSLNLTIVDGYFLAKNSLKTKVKTIIDCKNVIPLPVAVVFPTFTTEVFCVTFDQNIRCAEDQRGVSSLSSVRQQAVKDKDLPALKGVLSKSSNISANVQEDKKGSIALCGNAPRSRARFLENPSSMKMRVSIKDVLFSVCFGKSSANIQSEQLHTFLRWVKCLINIRVMDFVLRKRNNLYFPNDRKTMNLFMYLTVHSNTKLALSNSGPNLEPAEEVQSKLVTLLPLHQAVMDKNLSAIKSILDNSSVDANAQDEEGRTALHLAIESNCLSVVKLLVQSGKFDLNAKNRNSKTPLQLALAEDCFSLGIDLVGFREYDSNIINIIKERLYIIECLLQSGKITDLNSQDSEGMTPLHWAVKRNYWTTVDYLLGLKKININIQDNKGKTVLDLAQQARNWRIIRMIESYNEALVNLQSKYSVQRRNLKISGVVALALVGPIAATSTLISLGRINPVFAPLAIVMPVAILVAAALHVIKFLFESKETMAQIADYPVGSAPKPKSVMTTTTAESIQDWEKTAAGFEFYMA